MVLHKIIGLPLFSVSLKQEGNSHKLGVLIFSNIQNPLHVFGRDGVEIEPDAVLEVLTDNWIGIASPFMNEPLDYYEFDIASFVPLSSAEPIKLKRQGSVIEFVHSDNMVIELGPDSVCVVEVLLSLGNQLASAVPGESSKRWYEVSVKTELPSFPVVDGNDFTQSREELNKESAWYAKALHQSFDGYVRAALWVCIQQMAFGVGIEGYSDQYPRDVTTLPLDLPSMVEMKPLMEQIAAKLNDPSYDFYEQALAMRNIDARKLTVFERFYHREGKTLSKKQYNSGRT